MARPVRLTKPLERVIHEGHPWIYRDALEPHDAQPGDVVTVHDKRGRFVCRGHADSGPIAVRVWTTEDESLARLYSARFTQALALRAWIRPPDSDAYRLVHGEADRMPGCVIDRYGPIAVMRLDGDGATALREPLVLAAEPQLRALGIETLLWRVGRKQQIDVQAAFGSMPTDRVVVTERGTKLVADLEHGQKTGLFLDLRESRYRVRQLSQGKRVLNLYGYTGGFSVAAALGGATHVTTVDIAPEAVKLTADTYAANGLDQAQHDAVTSDVPAYLDQLSGEAEFDIIICDPPSFAPSERALPAALDSYRALHERCMRRVTRGGLYLAASCSSHVNREAFEETLREGARRARRVVQVLERSGAPADHPRLLGFPEFDYLKVTLCRVL
ncbi:MAG: class I SAM-dependent rRNA methyltransferase [Myxococcales bacterium]|nr:class I SAM-dependent rRNA methyltransferase [Myxococcales bacterium]MCB9626292.1 class I SAM-dependent rRNA methyltransferase [Sandaracinaceae bacterium]